MAEAANSSANQNVQKRRRFAAIIKYLEDDENSDFALREVRLVDANDLKRGETYLFYDPRFKRRKPAIIIAVDEKSAGAMKKGTNYLLSNMSKQEAQGVTPRENMFSMSSEFDWDSDETYFSGAEDSDDFEDIGKCN